MFPRGPQFVCLCVRNRVGCYVLCCFYSSRGVCDRMLFAVEKQNGFEGSCVDLVGLFQEGE